jgi:hypothetical protein
VLCHPFDVVIILHVQRILVILVSVDGLVVIESSLEILLLLSLLLFLERELFVECLHLRNTVSRKFLNEKVVLLSQVVEAILFLMSFHEHFHLDLDIDDESFIEVILS